MNFLLIETVCCFYAHSYIRRRCLNRNSIFALRRETTIIKNINQQSIFLSQPHFLHDNIGCAPAFPISPRLIFCLLFFSLPLSSLVFLSLQCTFSSLLLSLTSLRSQFLLNLPTSRLLFVLYARDNGFRICGSCS